MYQQKRDKLLKALRDAGLDPVVPKVHFLSFIFYLSFYYDLLCLYFIVVII